MARLRLAAGDVRAELDEPGSGYTGTRFDWTSQLVQLSWRGQTFLTQEDLSAPPTDQGWGLAGEFGIETALGYDECAPGDWFPKLGVGLLRRRDAGPYRFYRRHELRAAAFATERRSEASAAVRCVMPEVRGLSATLERVWSVDEAGLTLATTLANTGTRDLRTEDYIHNFVRFGDALVDPSWRLDLGLPVADAPLGKLDDPAQVLAFEGNVATWVRAPRRDFFFSRTAQPAPRSWTLARGDARLTETVDFAPLRLNVWGRAHTVTPELFHGVALAPGATETTTRRWTFA